MPDDPALTPGERWWLARRRRGVSQGVVAAELGVCLTYYQRVERDRRHLVAAPRVNTITRLEKFALARRRTHLTLREVGEELGVCHVTVLNWERLALPRLIEFWRRRGQLV